MTAYIRQGKVERYSGRTWDSLVFKQRFTVVYLRFIFNCCARHLTLRKISGEYVIKNVGSGVKLGHTGRSKTSGEYVI